MVGSSKKYKFIADKPYVRLDRYVADNCPDLSRTQVQKLISDSYIVVNNCTAKASLNLNVGDTVDVFIPTVVSNPLLSETIPLGIIYENEDILVIDKPAGLTVHPAPGHLSHTLVNAILSYLSIELDTGNTIRPGIVHRLDKDTSGVMVVAKNVAAQTNLSKQFKARSVAKVYLVLVRGLLTPERGIVEAPIERDPSHRKRMAVTTEGRGKLARTQYNVIKYIDNCTLLEVAPETGRTHQIRVHLSAIGYPVMGDTTYGVKSVYLSRQFIHASRLGFYLPSSGEYMEFESRLPEDLERVLKEIT